MNIILNKELVIVIVLFKPTLEQLHRIEFLSSYYDLIVVDNTPIALKSEFQISIKNGEYIALNENKGIAFAQNTAIELVMSKGKKYILFLDQDTDVDFTYPVTKFMNLKKMEIKDSRIVALGPMILDKETHKPYKYYSTKQFDENIILSPTLISSGTISPIWAFQKIGMMDEKLFIDYVDHEWCWRANSKGYICCMDLRLKMEHKVGYKTAYCFGFPYLLASPFRYFYQYRNSIWLQKRKYVPFTWKVKTFIRNIIGIFYIPFVSVSPFSCLQYMVKGILAGIFK